MIFTSGMPAFALDGACGEVCDLVVDPITWEVTHLVIEPNNRKHDHSRLIPISAVKSADQTVEFSLSLAEIAASPLVEETSFIPLGSWPSDKASWDTGISRVLSWPYYPYDGELGGRGLMGYPYGHRTLGELSNSPVVTMTYDRIPKGTVELRRASRVLSSDNFHVGHVDGFAVNSSSRITHLILEQGHLWGHRDVSIPIDAIDAVTMDLVKLNVTRETIGDYPSVPFRRHTLAF